MTPFSTASQLKSGQCLLLHVYDCEWEHCCCPMYTCVFHCACIQRLLGCWYRPGAFQIQLLILLPIRSPIVVPLCPCRQRGETIASHLCNLQTSSICSISARASAEMHGSLTCSAVSPGLQCGPQMCAADSFLYLSTQLCLIGPSAQTAVQIWIVPPQVPFVLPSCLVSVVLHSPCVFCLVGRKCFPTKLQGD